MKSIYVYQSNLLSKYAYTYSQDEMKILNHKLDKLNREELFSKLKQESNRLDKRIDYLLNIRDKLANKLPLTDKERKDFGLD